MSNSTKNHFMKGVKKKRVDQNHQIRIVFLGFLMYFGSKLVRFSGFRSPLFFFASHIYGQITYTQSAESTETPILRPHKPSRTSRLTFLISRVRSLGVNVFLISDFAVRTPIGLCGLFLNVRFNSRR